MKQKMTPTQALDLVEREKEGSDFSKNLIENMRERFASPEKEGAHPWKMLCEEISQQNDGSNVEQERMCVIQACADVLLDGGHLQSDDGLTWSKRIADLSEPKDFLHLFEVLRIPDEEWKSSRWLQNDAGLPVEKGGIGKKMHGLYEAIRKRFHSYKEFKAWMMNSSTPATTFIETVQSWEQPLDAMRYFESLNLTSEQWRNSRWLMEVAKLPPEQGGIGFSLAGLVGAVGKRFGGYPKFKAWVDQEEARSADEIVFSWKTPQDARDYFSSLGAQEEKWRSSDWMQKFAKLPEEEGGIGISLISIYKAIHTSFGGQKEFRGWLDGKQEKELTYIDIVQSWQTPEDALNYFASIGAKEREWESTGWFYSSNHSSLPQKRSDTLQGLSIAIRKRFNSHREFVAWMDGTTEVKKSFTEEVAAWQSPQDALQYFEVIGLPDNKWRTTTWLTETSKLSAEAGGIGKSMCGLSDAIRARFGTHPHFVAWMEGAPLIESVESTEQARGLIQQECERLGITTEEYLDTDPKMVRKHCSISPPLRAILEFFRSLEK